MSVYTHIYYTGTHTYMHTCSDPHTGWKADHFVIFSYSILISATSGIHAFIHVCVCIFTYLYIYIHTNKQTNKQNKNRLEGRMCRSFVVFWSNVSYVTWQKRKDMQLATERGKLVRESRAWAAWQVRWCGSMSISVFIQIEICPMFLIVTVRWHYVFVYVYVYL